jgi:hypothetical protein
MQHTTVFRLCLPDYIYPEADSPSTFHKGNILSHAGIGPTVHNTNSSVCNLLTYRYRPSSNTSSTTTSSKQVMNQFRMCFIYVLYSIDIWLYPRLFRIFCKNGAVFGTDRSSLRWQHRWSDSYTDPRFHRFRSLFTHRSVERRGLGRS